MTQPAYLEWIYDPKREFKGKESAIWGNWNTAPTTGQEAFEMLDDFHQGQCAMCGRTKLDNLVLDHCHESDLIRGYLCTSCNVQEGHGGHMAYAIYRRFYPTKLLNIELHYGRSSGYEYYGRINFMTKESKQVRKWSEEKCLEVYAEYLNWRVNLHWMSEYDFREFLERANRIIIDDFTDKDGTKELIDGNRQD